MDKTRAIASARGHSQDGRTYHVYRVPPWDHDQLGDYSVISDRTYQSEQGMTWCRESDIVVSFNSGRPE